MPSPGAGTGTPAMADRLLHLIEADGVSSAGRLVAWLAGGLIGAVIAAGALVLLLGAHVS
jgi:hypothetical protein